MDGAPYGCVAARRRRMTARRIAGAGVVRSIGVAARDVVPIPIAQADARYVALDRMREQIDRVEWAPLRLSGAERSRPASPRVPHALVLHVAHAARLASVDDGSLADVPVVLDVGALAGYVGADEDGVAGTLRALWQAGALRAADRTSVHGTGVPGTTPDALPPAVTLAPTLLGPAPRCAALDWDRLALATAGAPSAWVAAHVLAVRLVLDEWTPMPRRALEHTLGCGVSGVRSALERLTVAGVVERREQRGGVSAYRFSSAMHAAGAPGQGADVPRQPSRQPAQHPTPPAPPQVTPAGAAAAPTAPAAPAAPATGVRLTVGGVDLDVPSGFRVRIEIGADGTPQIMLAPAATPPS